MTVLGASGDLVGLCEPGISSRIPETIEEEIKQVLESKCHYQSNDLFIGYYPTGEDSHNILYVKLDHPLDALQRKTLEMFASNVAVIFQNLTQKEDIQKNPERAHYGAERRYRNAQQRNRRPCKTGNSND